jgi:glycosyltransferase involved in cell wall biosynthesis
VRIIVASTIVPLLRGGGTAIVDDLVDRLRDAGHEVDTVLVPFASDQPTMSQQMLALRLLEISQASDLLIAIRTPSYLLRHPNKVVWFLHHHRPSFDLWSTGYRDLPRTEDGIRQRRHLLDADNVGLREAKRVFSNSQVVADRLLRFNGVRAEVLYPPLGRPDGYRSEGFGDYVFCPSRIAHVKRQWLLVESMAHVRSGARLVIAGHPDAPVHVELLESLVAEHGLEDRVVLLTDWISEERKRELFARALACAYVPLDEDSYGYVSLESFHSRKPVITCVDSGGTLELVEDGVTGRVVEGDPMAVAEAIDGLYADPAGARRMGEAGYERMGDLNISWPHVIERLTA